MEKKASRLLSSFSREDIEKIITGKINVICMDFGHGESTAAIMEFKAEGDKVVCVDVKPLNTSSGGDLYKHPTYLYMPADSKMAANIQIGEDAVKMINSDPKSGDFYAYFKAIPSLADNQVVSAGQTVNGEKHTHRELMKAYVQKYMDLVFTPEVQNPVLKDRRDNDTVLVIGRPSGKAWDAEEDEYRKIFEGITVSGRPVKKVLAVSEAFAALAQSLNTKEELNYHPADTVVSIDMGSSTGDISCVHNGKVYDFGKSLGAHLVEENMLKLVLAKFDKNPSDLYRPYFEELCNFRIFKENFFGNSTSPGNVNQYVSLPYRKGGDFFNIDRECMNSALKGVKISIRDKEAPEGRREYDSWYDACKIFFEEVSMKIRELIEKGEIPRVKTVILTGGASRMGFIRELAEEAFRNIALSENFIYQSKEPSNTVSFGLAWVIHNAARTEKIRFTVEDGLNTKVKENANYASLYSSISDDVMAEIYYNQINADLQWWRNLNITQSVNNVLTNKTQPACEEALKKEENKDKIKVAVERWWNNGGVDTGNILNWVKGEFSVLFSMDFSEVEVDMPEDLPDNVAEAVREINIKISASNPVRCLLSPWGWGIIVQLDNLFLSVGTRQNYCNRCADRANTFKEDMRNSIAEQLDEKIGGNINQKVEALISEAIDQQIDDISMYCFRAKNDDDNSQKGNQN